MIKSAKENGADLAKFQLYDAEDDRDSNYYGWVKARQLTFNQAKVLFDYGESIDMEVFFSVFKPEYVDWCEEIGVKRYKLSKAGYNDALLSTITNTGKQLFISSETDAFYPFGTEILYCPDGYPMVVDYLPDFEHEDNDFIGFSDHTIGLDAAKIALARGAEIIEKHFILNRFIPAPDRDWSMIPEELKELKRWELVCQSVLK